MLRGRPDDGRWTFADRVMALALTAYEDGLCRGCGLHSSVAHGDHNVGRFEVHDSGICHGCEPLESKQVDKNREAFPGQKLTIREVEGWS